jgi:hypothetical protein
MIAIDTSRLTAATIVARLSIDWPGAPQLRDREPSRRAACAARRRRRRARHHMIAPISSRAIDT